MQCSFFPSFQVGLAILEEINLYFFLVGHFHDHRYLSVYSIMHTIFLFHFGQHDASTFLNGGPRIINDQNMDSTRSYDVNLHPRSFVDMGSRETSNGTSIFKNEGDRALRRYCLFF